MFSNRGMLNNKQDNNFDDSPPPAFSWNNNGNNNGQNEFDMNQQHDQQDRGGNGGGGANGNGHQHNTHYSIPGILQFIQSEWSRFELERAQWKVEKAELTAQVAFLQGEQKGQQNLRRDLIRRIKMLEFALKQERQRYYGQGYKTEKRID